MQSESLALSTCLAWINAFSISLRRAKKAGVLLSFEELNQIMDTPRATLYRHVQNLVERGVVSKRKDPNDGRRQIISVVVNS